MLFDSVSGTSVVEVVEAARAAVEGEENSTPGPEDTRGLLPVDGLPLEVLPHVGKLTPTFPVVAAEGGETLGLAGSGAALSLDHPLALCLGRLRHQEHVAPAAPSRHPNPDPNHQFLHEAHHLRRSDRQDQEARVGAGHYRQRR